MPDITVRAMQRPFARAGCVGMDLEEELAQRGLARNEAKALLESWAGFRTLLERSSSDSFARAPYFLTEAFKVPHAGTITEETRIALNQLLDELNKVPYEVIILNSTDSDLEDLTISIF